MSLDSDPHAGSPPEFRPAIDVEELLPRYHQIEAIPPITSDQRDVWKELRELVDATRSRQLTEAESAQHTMLTDEIGRRINEQYEYDNQLWDRLQDQRSRRVKLEVKGGSKDELDAATAAYKQTLLEVLKGDIEDSENPVEGVLFRLVTETKEREKEAQEARDATVGGRIRKFFRNHPAVRFGTAAALVGGSLVTAKAGMLPEIATQYAEYLATLMMSVASYASTRDSIGAVLRRRGEKQDAKVDQAREKDFYTDKEAVDKYVGEFGSLQHQSNGRASDDERQNRRLIQQTDRRSRPLGGDEQGQLVRKYSEQILSNDGLIDHLKLVKHPERAAEVLSRILDLSLVEENQKFARERRNNKIKKILGAVIGAATLGAAALYKYERIDAVEGDDK